MRREPHPYPSSECGAERAGVSEEMITSGFVAPPDWDVFSVSVRERCEDLITTKVWQGLENLTLMRWLKNYHSAEEQYFAACLLDCFIYRSQPQTVALMEHLFQFAAPHRLRGASTGVPPSQWYDALQSKSDAGIRIVPVLRTSDPPTKSGPLLARMYRQQLSFEDRWMIWPWQVAESVRTGISTFVFIDDLLGTGTQLARFVDQHNIRTLFAKAFFAYLPLAGHQRGFQKLKDTIPELGVCAAEYITDAAGLFHPQSLAFRDGINSAKSARRFYLGMLRNRGIDPGSKYIFGWGKLALTYAFAHATPNNSIPLLWHAGSSWAPLTPR